MIVIEERLARIQEIADLIPAAEMNALGLTSYRTSSFKTRFYLGFTDRSVAVTEVSKTNPVEPGDEPETEIIEKVETQIEVTLVDMQKVMLGKVSNVTETTAGLLGAIKGLLLEKIPAQGVAKDKKHPVTA